MYRPEVLRHCLGSGILHPVRVFREPKVQVGLCENGLGILLVESLICYYPISVGYCVSGGGVVTPKRP